MDKNDICILLAEDQPSLQFLVQKQLGVLGYPKVDVVSNGVMAVEKAKTRRYQLIFMDVMMPDLDGILATQRIRSFEAGMGVSSTPIIAMTGITDKEKCLQAGMNDVLQKPVMLDSLKQKLDKWLKNSNQVFNEPRMMNITIDIIDEKQFSQTAQRLEEIQTRINDLRKRFGLND